MYPQSQSMTLSVISSTMALPKSKSSIQCMAFPSRRAESPMMNCYPSSYNNMATSQVDNACAEGIINATIIIKQCHSKAIDMRFYWPRDHVAAQGQFSIHWKSGATNLASDYYTLHIKHHAPQLTTS
jgi:hypothetical protein